MKEARLLFSIIFNVSIVVSEIVGGLISGSIALLSDAVHNSTDVLSMIFSYAATKISKREKNEKYTYGYKRAEVVAALVNGVFLMIIGGFMIFEGIRKLMNPEIVSPQIMLPVATIGLAGNILTILFLHEHRYDVNIRSTLVHITADTLSSAFVTMLGILLLFKPWYFLDGVVSIAISTYMLVMGWKIFKQTSSILMQVRPDWIDLNIVKSAVESLEAVLDVHHIHIWTMDGKDAYAELHITLKNQNADIDAVRDAVKEKIHGLGISHATIQIENRSCES